MSFDSPSVEHKENMSATKQRPNWVVVDTMQKQKQQQQQQQQQPQRLNVYVSLTVISPRRSKTKQTILSLCRQTVNPTQVFVFVSPDPYLLDNGIDSRSLEREWWDDVFRPYADQVTIRETSPNTGSYRKLFPLLQEKYNEPNCCILTVDDDQIYSSGLIESYLNTYRAYGPWCVVADRTFALSSESARALRARRYRDVRYPSSFEEGRKRIPPNTPYYTSIFTGRGGVLYNPEVFRRVLPQLLDTAQLRTVAPTADDLWLSVACWFLHVPTIRPGLLQTERDICTASTWWGWWLWGWGWKIIVSSTNMFGLTQGVSLYELYNKRDNTDQLQRVLYYWDSVMTSNGNARPVLRHS